MDKITLITHWYNEELLAPLFFNHYRYVDEVRVLLDTDTNDHTREIASRYPNVVIQNTHCPDQMDNIQMLDNINAGILAVKEGWVYMVDADEFMFPEKNENPWIFLGRQKSEVVNAYFYHVYRHRDEADIDPTRNPIPQRIHALDGGPEHKNYFWKPSVFRAEAKIQLIIGNHRFQGEHTTSNEKYIGAHWKQADPSICIHRRLSNMARHSQHDHQKGWGNHDFHVSGEKLMKQLNEKRDLPILPYFTEGR
jgi:hypothetical protein